MLKLKSLLSALLRLFNLLIALTEIFLLSPRNINLMKNIFHMALSVYNNFAEKEIAFKRSWRLSGGRIDDKSSFDNGYKRWTELLTARDPYTSFFRGMGEAKYKLLTSA